MTGKREPAHGAAPVAQIDRVMRAYQGAVPGAAVGVLGGGEVVVRRSYGLADLRQHTPVAPATNFRLASLTKSFTAASVLLLAQEGRLALEDPARRWLPQLPAVARAATIRHLLAHASGIVDYEELMSAGEKQQVRDADVLELLAGEPRTYFPPGTAYRYSNSAYALLSLIVAQASGESFASFLRKRIFAPLGMSGSVAYEAEGPSPRHRAFGYRFKDPQWIDSDQSLTSAVLGDGGVYSSIDDLARWDAALAAPGLFSAETLRLAFTPVTPTDDPNIRYALGWRITGETAWYSGETLGFRNAMVRWSERRFTVVVLTNRNEPEVYGLALAIAKLFLADADATRAERVVVGPDPGAS